MTDYERLDFVPEEMHPWVNTIEQPIASEKGEFVVVRLEQSPVEQNHQVIVLDENGLPFPHAGVFFGLPGHNQSPGVPMPRHSYWKHDRPRVLGGNYQVSGHGAFCQHTVGGGGEDVWVWQIGEDGTQLYSSHIVKGMGMVSGAPGRNNHTCVRVTFQLRRPGVVVEPITEKVDRLELSLGRLSEKVEKLVQTLG